MGRDGAVRYGRDDLAQRLAAYVARREHAGDTRAGVLAGLHVALLVEGYVPL